MWNPEEHMWKTRVNELREFSKRRRHETLFKTKSQLKDLLRGLTCHDDDSYDDNNDDGNDDDDDELQNAASGNCQFAARLTYLNDNV